MSAAAQSAPPPRCRILIGDVRQQMPRLDDQSVQCAITSPPYFGLRDYGTGEWTGGDPLCDHKKQTRHQAQGSSSARAGRSNADAQRNENFSDTCGLCDAQRVDKQIGLERTPVEYVESLRGGIR